MQIRLALFIESGVMFHGSSLYFRLVTALPNLNQLLIHFGVYDMHNFPRYDIQL